MKRVLMISAVALIALATAASAQLMGSGRNWISGDGGIPQYSNTLDGDIQNMKDNGYHLWWGPSDIFAWGDKYGYSVDTNLETARLVVRAFDVDNNLYCGESEDPSDCGTDADIYLNYWFSWDATGLHVAGDVIDNNYDIIAGADDPDWAFWKRDHFWMSLDLTGIGLADMLGPTIPHYHAHPMPVDEAVYSIQIHWSIDGDATEIMYGDDPDFFQGSSTSGGPTADGYWFETNATWDLLFTFAPELQGNVGDGYEFRMRFIIPDPDGDDAYGQTFWGVDYTTNTQSTYWPLFRLQGDLSPTAVEATSWGSIKQLY